MRKIFILIIYLGIIALASTAFLGCSDFWDCEDCNDLIEDEIDKRGSGDCSSMEWSDGTWCVDCWWWDQGVSKTWCEWGDCGCDVSTYKFSPIGGGYSTPDEPDEDSIPEVPPPPPPPPPCNPIEEVIITPNLYDFGVVEFQESASTEFTITATDADIEGEKSCPIELNWSGLVRETFLYNFSYDWDNSNDIYQIYPGESLSFTIIYKPQTWNEEHHSYITFSPTYQHTLEEYPFPDLRIDLYGTGTSDIPEISYFSYDSCECPDDTMAHDLCLCFEDKLMCSGESDYKTVVLTNDGALDLQLSGTGETSNCDFSMYYNGEKITYYPDRVSNLETVLAPGESIELQVIFHPFQSENRSALFKFKTNDPNKEYVHVRVYGWGIYDNKPSGCTLYCPY